MTGIEGLFSALHRRHEGGRLSRLSRLNIFKLIDKDDYHRVCRFCAQGLSKLGDKLLDRLGFIVINQFPQTCLSDN